MTPFFISPNDWAAILFRLGLALLFGATIGLEREQRHKPAGLRTHMLVSLGSALLTLIPLQAVSLENYDPLSRTIQGIATGVGFLGAGEILKKTSHESGDSRIRGLTSAAAIWVSAALGVVAACGLWQLGLMGCTAAVIILAVLKRVE